jgi:hypothetical protein
MYDEKVSIKNEGDGKRKIIEMSSSAREREKERERYEGRKSKFSCRLNFI